MSANEEFRVRFDECPLVAIIRGVRPDEAEAIGEAIYDAGIRIIEVPLNSPKPLDSIARLQSRLGERALIGAGTVLTRDQVEQVREAGGRLIVSPNLNVDVVRNAIDAGMVSMPGFFTPSEAFEGIQAGVHALKLFPAEGASPEVLKSMRAVIPRDVPVLVVGGVTPESMAGWASAGADGFGLGGGLYKPDQSPQDTHDKALAYVRAVKC